MAGMSGQMHPYAAYGPLANGQGVADQQHSQQQQQQHLPPIQGAGQYYLAPGQPFPLPPEPHARYPIPPADSRNMSGGKHKKEIKRRTKTGCLTCRKRRIKCDETHPHCRNCEKSKRECLGYDPIFKPQPGPAAIQPALGAGPDNNNNNNNSNSNSTSPYPQTYASAYPGYPAPPITSPPAIDPALAGAMAQSGTGATSQEDNGKHSKIDALFAIRGFQPPPIPPFGPVPEELLNHVFHAYNSMYAPALDKFLETKWFSLRGESHLKADPVLQHRMSVLVLRYPMADEHDVQITCSLEASVLWSLMGMCRPATVAVSNTENPLKSEGEQDPKASSSPPSSPKSKFTDEDMKEGVLRAGKRVEILEALLTNEYLPTNSSPDPTTNSTLPATSLSSNGTIFEDQLRTRELSFWSLAHKFLTTRDDEASSAKEIDNAIASCRGLLDSRENRDIIYSIIIARHIGARMAEFPDSLGQATNNEESDNKTKLIVAKRFLEEEAFGKGTNQVAMRIAGMATRSWTLK